MPSSTLMTMRGLGGAFDDARSENADDAAMPAVAIDDKQARGRRTRHRWRAASSMAARAEASVSRRSRFRRSSLLASSCGAGSIAGAEEFDDFRGHIHPAGGVDARREAEGDIETGERLGGGIKLSRGEQCAQTGADGTAQLAQAESGDDSILTMERNSIGDGGDGGHLEKAGQ